MEQDSSLAAVRPWPSGYVREGWYGGVYPPMIAATVSSGLPPLGPGRLVLLHFGGANPLFEIISCCCVTEGQSPQPSTTLLLRVGVIPPHSKCNPSAGGMVNPF